MPNLVDIVEVAEALESKAVYLASDRCVVVRNRHASCAKCADACPTGSVFAANNERSAPQVAPPPTEPAGRAPNGMAYAR